MVRECCNPITFYILKSPIQWICRECVRKLDFNKSDNNYCRSRWQENKEKLVLSKESRSQLNPMRLVFIYKSFEFDYKSHSCCYSVFLSIFWSPILRYSFSFILSSFFYLHPPRVDQVSNVDPCPISTFLKSLGVTVRLKIIVHVSLPH